MTTEETRSNASSIEWRTCKALRDNWNIGMVLFHQYSRCHRSGFPVCLSYFDRVRRIPSFFSHRFIPQRHVLHCAYHVPDDSQCKCISELAPACICSVRTTCNAVCNPAVCNKNGGPLVLARSSMPAPTDREPFDSGLFLMSPNRKPTSPHKTAHTSY